MHVAVIGAGLAGLSAACHLRSSGHDVTVIESGDGPGGRCGTRTIDGFRFDTGPTVLTFPHLIDDCFRAVCADPREYLTVRRLDPMYRACFADGSTLHVRAELADMVEEITHVCGPAEADAFVRFCAWLRSLYEAEFDSFIDRNFESPLSLLRAPVALARLVRLGGFRRLDNAVRGFFRDERLVRLFSFQSMYAGVAPHRALALYAVITYMDSVAGVYSAEGGMHAVPTALARAAVGAGVVFRYDTPVDRVLLAGGTSGPVRGVRLVDGEIVACDAALCTPDLPVAYRTLLPGVRPPRRLALARFSPSAAVWHAGVSGPADPAIAHHNIHFGSAWSSAFEALFERGERMPDPSILVSVPTVSEPSMAPPGSHVVFALEPVPNLDGAINWRFERERVRAQLAARVAGLGYPSTVAAEWFVDPADWAAQGMERGTPFALSHRFLQSGPFRPGNTVGSAPGLVFAGSGTVPGVGVPMVVLSGRLAAERVEELAA